MNLLREEARAWIQRALIASFPDNHAAHPVSLEEYGDALFLIAETHQIPDESLRFWIHDKPGGKDWSLAAWRAWCVRYSDLRAKVGEEPPAAPPDDSGASTARESALCMRCWANELQPIGESLMWCSKCGEVQV